MKRGSQGLTLGVAVLEIYRHTLILLFAVLLGWTTLHSRSDDRLLFGFLTLLFTIAELQAMRRAIRLRSQFQSEGRPYWQGLYETEYRARYEARLKRTELKPGGEAVVFLLGIPCLIGFTLLSALALRQIPRVPETDRKIVGIFLSLLFGAGALSLGRLFLRLVIQSRKRGLSLGQTFRVLHAEGEERRLKLAKLGTTPYYTSVMTLMSFLTAADLILILIFHPWASFRDSIFTKASHQPARMWGVAYFFLVLNPALLLTLYLYDRPVPENGDTPK